MNQMLLPHEKDLLILFIKILNYCNVFLKNILLRISVLNQKH